MTISWKKLLSSVGKEERFRLEFRFEKVCQLAVE